MDNQRQARLFRNGSSQAVRIPRDFEFPGSEVILHKDGERLIIEAKKKKQSLLDLLKTLEPIEDEFPDIDDLPPLDDVKF